MFILKNFNFVLTWICAKLPILNTRVALELRLVWLAVVWAIWNSRNDIIFAGGTPTVALFIDKVKLASWKWFLVRVLSVSAPFTSGRRNLSCAGSGRGFGLWVLVLSWGVVVCQPLLSVCRGCVFFFVFGFSCLSLFSFLGWL